MSHVHRNLFSNVTLIWSQQEAWVATDGDGACREARQQAPAPAPASSLAEPCLLSSFVEMSEICPSMTLGSSSVGVDSGSSSKRDAAEAAPQQASPAPAKKGGYDVAYPDRGTVISRYKEKRKNRR